MWIIKKRNNWSQSISDVTRIYYWQFRAFVLISQFCKSRETPLTSLEWHQYSLASAMRRSKLHPIKDCSNLLPPWTNKKQKRKCGSESLFLSKTPAGVGFSPCSGRIPISMGILLADCRIRPNACKVLWDGRCYINLRFAFFSLHIRESYLTLTSKHWALVRCQVTSAIRCNPEHRRTVYKNVLTVWGNKIFNINSMQLLGND